MNEIQRPTDNEPFEKQRISKAVLGSILVCGAIGTLLWLGRGNLTAFPSPSATTTPSVTTTFTPTSSPTATPTRMQRPTPTATPIPAWVTEFAEPILAAMANTPPRFQDDFSQASDNWRIDSRCRMKIKDSVFTMSVEEGRDAAYCHHPGMQRNNFVLSVNVDLHELGSNDSADIFWRGKDYSNCLAFSLWKDGFWSISACRKNLWIKLDSGRHSISPAQKVTVIIISKGSEYGIYMDEAPVSYINDSGQYPGIVIKLGLSVPSTSPNPMVAYDNLKIWDLDYIPDPP
jgi:hypothetical protein